MPRTKYYRDTPENRWLAGAVEPANAAIAAARGDWIARCDDDDIWTPSHIEQLLRFAQAGKFEFVSGAYERERDGIRDIVHHDEENPPIGGTAPVLTGNGSLCGGSPITIDLSGAHPNSIGWLIVGLSELNGPFKGGILVPSPDIFMALPTNGSGAFSLNASLPGELPSQLATTLQFWVVDPQGVQGFAASNGLQLITP